jgi:hypothetical protein
MGWLGPALLAVSKARGAHLQGKGVAEQRQSQADRVAEAQSLAVIKQVMDAQERKRDNEALQADRDRNYGLRAQEMMNKPEAVAPRDPVADHQAKRLFDIQNPLPQRPRLGGGRSSSGGADPTEPSAGDARRAGMADKFVDMYLGAYGNSYTKAVKAIESSPAEMAKAKSLGLTDAHWRAGVMRAQAKAAKPDKIDY